MRTRHGKPHRAQAALRRLDGPAKDMSDDSDDTSPG